MLMVVPWCALNISQVTNICDLNLPTSGDACPQRNLHHCREHGFLSQINLFPVDLLPLERPHQVGDEVLEMEHGQPYPRANPPPRPEWHHLHLPAPRYVRVHPFASGQEPLRPELHGLLPRLRVPVDVRHREVDGRVLGYHVSIHGELLRYGVGQNEVRWRVPPESFHDYRLERRRGGVRAGVEELGAEGDDLLLVELSVVFFRQLQVEEGIHVREVEAVLAGRAPSSHLLSARSYQREVDLPLPLAQLQQLPPRPSEHVLGKLGHEGEDVEFADEHEQVPLRFLNIADGLLVELLAEAHEHEQTEHGVLEALHDDHDAIAGARAGTELVEEDAEDPLAGMRICLDARRVKDLQHQVATEEAPQGPVARGADVVLVPANESDAGEGCGAVGEDGAVLDEQLVGDLPA
ncbi:hypothetical protein Taro_028732 [Colocasia esculenta]|uniref:Uncharacterized protein n=1 Tax=Colocasia esculenta TaxID=4460 RepID=A0A843VJD6_COLES|nr:hypothetical protein [Colocasia esculenta]